MKRVGTGILYAIGLVWSLAVVLTPEVFLEFSFEAVWEAFAYFITYVQAGAYMTPALGRQQVVQCAQGWALETVKNRE